jgi:heme exporter protein D
MLIVFAVSPILVHGTELGRPDHQSLLILLVTIGICADWRFQTVAALPSPGSGVASMAAATERNRLAAVSGAAWGLAIWVSAYEPLVLLLLMIALLLAIEKNAPQSGAATATARRAWWILFALIIAAALLIERRIPSFAIPESSAIFKNWASTIGELSHVSPTNPIWFRWCGCLLLITPFLIWLRVRARKDGAQGLRALPVFVLLVATYGLTIWQVRWAYFFVLIFALALPALLAPIKSGAAVWIAFGLSTFPILRFWDETLWPNETQLASNAEKRIESAQIREVALTLASSELQPFLAPWWLSPSITYWSGQPGVTGSSHESLKGIEDSARFFLSNDVKQARAILHKDNVAWVFAYDSQRVTQNSAALLNEAVPADPLSRVLDRTPGRAPPFLIFSAQTPACKLYRVSIER